MTFQQHQAQLEATLCVIPWFPHDLFIHERMIMRRQKKWPCQLNDVWSLSLTTLTWRELTPPKWCSKRCAHEYGHREEEAP